MAGNVPDTGTIRAILEEYKPNLVVIESVHAMPKQGVSSTFTFGRSFGRIETIVEMLRIPHELITPQKWKATVLAGTAKDKAAAIEYVQRRHPDVNLIQPKCRTPHDGIADAICMADAGLKLFGMERAA
jgi:crossover junction endodeoxyribonuclease RuvC